MEKIDYSGMRGRKQKLVQLDNGEQTVVKKLFKIGNGYALRIPTEWLALLDSKGMLEVGDYCFTFWYDEDKLIIEPLKSKVEGAL